MLGYRDAGILGFKSVLIGLALGKFYQLNTALWIMAPVSGAVYPSVSAPGRWPSHCA